MSCETFSNDLLARACGDPPAAPDDLRAHLLVCEGCSRRAADLDAIVTLYRSEPDPLPLARRPARRRPAFPLVSVGAGLLLAFTAWMLSTALEEPKPKRPSPAAATNASAWLPGPAIDAEIDSLRARLAALSRDDFSFEEENR